MGSSKAKQSLRKNLSETAVQRKIIAYLEKDGWFVIRLKVTGMSGIPDVLALKRDTPPFFVEVKRSIGGVVSPLQKYMIRKLNKLGFVAVVANSLDIVEKEVNENEALRKT